MKVKVATSQFKALKGDFDANLNKAISLVEKASNENVDILLLQELFQDHYFCSTKNDKFFDLAIDFPSHPMFEKLSNICKDKKISLPISFFQNKENKFFNSLVMIDSFGKLSEVYNKSHIPEGPGYNEKYYFEKGKNVSDEVINLNKVKTKISSKKIVEKVKIKYFANRLIRRS